MKIVLCFLILTGRASQYGPGVMDSVIAVRQSGRTAYSLPAQLPIVDGYVAVPDCERIGSIISVRPVGTEKWESFLVVDCASKSDHQSETDPRSGYQWMMDGNVLVEVDHKTAVRWDTVGRAIDIEVINGS